MPPAELVYNHKAVLLGRYILELKIWRIPDPKRFPNGLKYSLTCLDFKTMKRVLYDNHHPKGPHFHLDETQYPYKFMSTESLIKDFKKSIHDHLGVKL